MTRQVEESIDVFSRHFREQLRRLEAYELDPQDRTLKKIVVVSIMDAISVSVSNHEEGNRQRFTTFVALFGSWPNHARVSTPHACYLLRKLHSPNFEQVRELLERKISSMSDGRLVPIAEDLLLEEMRHIWPVPVDQKLVGRLSLSSLTHLNLLYAHRNSLVHELREPATAWSSRATGRNPIITA